MKALIQTGSSLSACGHAQAGGRVPVPLKSDFLSIGVAFEFTEDLLQAGGWRNDGVAPVSRRKVAADDEITLRLPESVTTNRMLFLRMKAE